ncbi:AraC family transcriptional regulator [Cohnella silvisoli]|uniref:AraC family transcriptional regulator n=1 Tax=Cohnella silvisoli TaxID=2873699 RepID=A0ABV1L1T0_9BACL|nr:AraC family transcriptional regulator [Cohnella silvisoli]MCD9025401.1 AraC family transcriptional regulator [Cohnella silvisoli]
MSSSERAFPAFQIMKVSPGTIMYAPGSQLGPRIQRGWQLFLLDAGTTKLWIDSVCHTVLPGQVVLLKSKHSEKFEFDPHEETWHRWVTVDVLQIDETTEQQFRQLPFSLPISEEMSRLLNQMIALKFKESPENEMLLLSLGMASLYLYAAEAARQKRDGHENPAVFMAKRLIQNKFDEELDLSSLAEASNVTNEHLIRLFRQHMGITPVQYLWQYRVRQGVDLLLNTGLTVTEIAYRSGFKTSYHFARMVKKWTGRTPSDIRNEHWHRGKEL